MDYRRRDSRLSDRRTPRHVKRGVYISPALPLQPYYAAQSGVGNTSSYSRHSSGRFRRARAPVKPPSVSRYPTVSQSIAAQYRSRFSEAARRDDVTLLDFTQSFDDNSIDCASEYSSLMATRQPKPRFTSSCVMALENAHQEAYAMMIRGGYTHRNIVCTRPGCGQVLPDLRALTTHIHIHNLDSMDYQGMASYRAHSPRNVQGFSTPRRRYPQRSARWRKSILKALARILPFKRRARRD